MPYFVVLAHCRRICLGFRSTHGWFAGDRQSLRAGGQEGRVGDLCRCAHRVERAGKGGGALWRGGGGGAGHASGRGVVVRLQMVIVEVRDRGREPPIREEGTS